MVYYLTDYISDCDHLPVAPDKSCLLERAIYAEVWLSLFRRDWGIKSSKRIESYVERRYVEYYLNSIDLTPYISGAAQPKLNKRNLESINIPNPSPEEKERIVGILDNFDALTSSITEGLPREIELRQKQYEYYRDLLLSFPKPEEVET